MTKRALVVGINDYSAQAPRTTGLGLTFPVLNGCVNDARDVERMLGTAFGFDEIHVLLDKQATRTRILGTLRALVDASVAGDVVCFYYSGHGGILPATREPANTRFYEAIIPASGDWIFDGRLTQMADRFAPSQVNLTVILDSCHSGGMHRSDAATHVVPRSVPMTADLAGVVAHVQTLIPCGACLPPGSEAMDGNVTNPVVGDHGLTDLDADPDKTFVASAASTLLAACQYWESALEVGGHGLLTTALLETVDRSNYDESYSHVLDAVRASVGAAAAALGETQTPQLYGQLGRTDEGFLQPWMTSEPS